MQWIPLFSLVWRGRFVRGSPFLDPDPPRIPLWIPLVRRAPHTPQETNTCVFWTTVRQSATLRTTYAWLLDVIASGVSKCRSALRKLWHHPLTSRASLITLTAQCAPDDVPKMAPNAPMWRDCEVQIRKVLPETRTCLTQTGPSAGNTFSKPLFGTFLWELTHQN